MSTLDGAAGRPECFTSFSERATFTGDSRSCSIDGIAATVASRIGAERRFYLTFTVAVALAVFLGFARTFFLKAWYPTWAAVHGAPEPIFYLHGMLFAAWYAILIAQSSFIATRRVAWHRRLGFASAALAAMMVVFGVLGALVAARRPTGFIDNPLPPLRFLIDPLSVIGLFATFVALAFVRRRDKQAHKRYILLASIVIVQAAVARWPFAFMAATSPIPLFDMPILMTDLFLMPLAVWDVVSRGRLHRVTVWGTFVILIVQAVRMPLATTTAWQVFAARAVQLVGPR